MVVVSVDGLSSVDLPHLESLPNFRELIQCGSYCRDMRGIYPTQTYPLHASLITGCYPHRHGVHANTLFQPGRSSPDWHWFRSFLRVPPLYELATRAGLPTASLLWPGAARSRNRYVIPEIKTTRPGQCFPFLLLSSGSPLFILQMAIRYRSLLKGLEYVYLDNFTTAVASHLIRRRKTNLLLIHHLDLDGTRHRFGFRAPEIQKVLEDHDLRIGTLLAASRSSGIFEHTTFIVFGDHAYIDVHTRVRINAAFREAGLLELDAKGRLISWKAWANCCEGSAQISLQDPTDRTVHEALAELFARLKDARLDVVETVYPRDQIESMRLGDHLDYIVEARAGCYFIPDIEGEVVEPAEPGFRAVHGYHPDRPGYGSLFFAAGSGIRRGVQLEAMRIVDIGPTLAALLGLQLPDPEGRVLTEILDSR
ncbi:MAG: alkaline phosphatase family protein [Spirochaetaceae bacterium]|nr:MAG: alkaline phosphatase family protein [Spirochaetaceae bacterium]